jgi:hypothetical protein
MTLNEKIFAMRDVSQRGSVPPDMTINTSVAWIPASNHGAHVQVFELAYLAPTGSRAKSDTR